MKKIGKYIGFTLLSVFVLCVVHVVEVNAALGTMTGAIGGIDLIKGRATCTWNVTYRNGDNNFSATITRRSNDNDASQKGEWVCLDESSLCAAVSNVDASHKIAIPAPTFSKNENSWVCPQISYYIQNISDFEWSVIAVASVNNNSLSGLSGDSPNASLEKNVNGQLKGALAPIQSTVPNLKDDDSNNIKKCELQYDNSNVVRFEIDTSKVIDGYYDAKVYHNNILINPMQVSYKDCDKLKNVGYKICEKNGKYKITDGRCIEDGTLDWNEKTLDKSVTQDNISVANPNKPPTGNPDDQNIEIDWGSPVKGCQVIDDVYDIVQTIFDWVKILAPILLIVFGSLDFGKAVITNDNDALKKATSNFIKRAIATVAIFFLPLIINLLLKMPGIESGLNDALCGIGKVVMK